MIPTPGKPDVPRDQVRRNIIATLKEALPTARRAGITLTIENFPGATSPFVIAADVLEAVNAAPGLQLTFDNGNVFTGGEDPAKSFERCAAHIVHAHFKDWEIVAPDQGFKGLDGRHYRGALIGEGLIDHRRCLAAMKQAGYRGYIDLEYEGNRYSPEEATRRAGRYLQKLMAEV
jgi:sugar phosphate isomerase/epimerase